MKKVISYIISVPPIVNKIHELFNDNGYELFLIGGAVRDSLLNIQPKDFDLVTNALPNKVIELLKNVPFVTSILETGKVFGVINVITNDGEFEIATMREDGEYSSNRRPDSVTFTTIEKDVLRRDLRINALFYDISTKEVVDLVGGISDLQKGIIRTVGNPTDRFNEDKLRIIRSVRFSARFGSDLDSEIDAALKKDASLEGISGERIRDEFIKGVKSAKSVIQFLETLDKYNLLDWIFKGLHVNKPFAEDRDIIVLIAGLLNGNDIGLLNKQLNLLKYPLDEIKAVSFLISLLSLSPDTAVSLKRQQKNSHAAKYQIIAFARRNDMNLRLLNTFLNYQLTVTGEEVMREYNLPQGKALGDMINKLETNLFKEML